MFSLEPNRPIRCNNYVCDKTFQLDEFEKLQDEEAKEQTFGVAFINGRTSEFYLVSDLQVRLLGIITTTTMNHHRRGGSSSARLARLRENKIDHNVVYIADEVEKHFSNIPLLVGGCAEIRQQVVPELNCDVIDSFAWQGTGIASAQEFWATKREIAFDWMRKKEQNLLKPLWKIMNTEPDLLLYGAEIDNSICETIYYNANSYNQTAKSAKLVALYYTDSLDCFDGRIGIRKINF